MADDPITPEPEKDPEPTPEEDAPKPAADIPAEVKAALKKANKEAETLRLKLKEYEDRDKTEVDKLNERLALAERRALDAERLEVALDKGLTRTQAKRLVGSTREELEADADELIADLGPPSEDPRPAPSRKPQEQLKPGSSDPDAPVEETDVRKLGARMFQH